jgi:hypothetical protein
MRVRRRLLLSSVAVAALLAGGCAHGKPPSKGQHPMGPNEVYIPVPALQRTLLFAAPAYVSTSVEDTPYQWLQLCGAGGKSCRTLLDVRGAGGVSMPADKTLGLSPDGRYLLCLRMTGVDAAGRSYRGQYYELYDLVEGKAVTFNTDAGVTATTDNIQGWSADRSHTLEVSTTFRKTSLAFPPGEN